MPHATRLRQTAAIVAASLSLAGLTAGQPSGEVTADYEQWHLAAVNAPAAWDHGLGEGVVVAIIDGGADLGHPEFATTRLLPGATVSGCDDAPVCGDGSRGPDGEEMFATEQHGTLMLGLMAAAHDGRGVQGIAPEATYLNIRAFEDGDASTHDIRAAMQFAMDQGADIINLSGSTLSGADLTERAIRGLEYTALVEEALDRDVLIVAAAGNNAYPFCEYPASHVNVICVVATDRRDLRAAYSSFGVRDSGVTVAAPGGSLGVLTAEGDQFEQLRQMCLEPIVTTAVRQSGARNVNDVCGWSYDYASASGTSMAAPMVAGIAALVRAKGCSATETRDILAATARPPTGMSVTPPGLGSGIVDAEAAVAATSGCTGADTGPGPRACLYDPTTLSTADLPGCLTD